MEPRRGSGLRPLAPRLCSIAAFPKKTQFLELEFFLGDETLFPSRPGIWIRFWSLLHRSCVLVGRWWTWEGTAGRDQAQVTVL